MALYIGGGCDTYTVPTYVVMQCHQCRHPFSHLFFLISVLFISFSSWSFFIIILDKFIKYNYQNYPRNFEMIIFIFFFVKRKYKETSI